MNSLLELEKEFLETAEQERVSLGGFAPVLEACVLGMEKRDWILTGPRGRLGVLLRGASKHWRYHRSVRSYACWELLRLDKDPFLKH